MSGGSYNYLCFHTDDLSNRRDTVKAMRDRLTELGYTDAAADTDQVLGLLDAAREQADRLSDMWYAVEWHRAGDWGDDQLDEALRTYGETRTATEVP